MATTGTADTSSQQHGTKPSQVSGIGQTLRDAAYQKLTDQKTRASETLGSVAGAVRGMTEPLREGGQSSIANYVDKAAEGMDRWAEQLRERNIDDTVRAIHDFARREPALFLGLAFGTGALLARFLKSSTGDSRSSYAAGSGRGWAGAASAPRRDVTTGDLSGRSMNMNTARVSEPTLDTPQTVRTPEETRASSETPSAREVL